jgi:hypothetical protein
VFYVTDGGAHGLEAAPFDWDGNGDGQDPRTTWSNITGTSSGASGTTIGTGLANSNAIIAQAGHTASAAKLCRDYSGGGITDWFLPSKDELNQMYTQKSVIGGYVSNNYWSSSENNASTAWGDNFSNGTLSAFREKYLSFWIRPIRAF